MMVTSKKSKVRIVVKTILFMVAFIVIVGGFLLLTMYGTNKNLNDLANAVSGQAVSAQAVSGDGTDAGK